MWIFRNYIKVGVAIVLAVSIANVGKSVPATPGAVGIYEGMLSGCFGFVWRLF